MKFIFKDTQMKCLAILFFTAAVNAEIPSLDDFYGCDVEHGPTDDHSPNQEQHRTNHTMREAWLISAQEQSEDLICVYTVAGQQIPVRLDTDDYCPDKVYF